MSWVWQVDRTTKLEWKKQAKAYSKTPEFKERQRRHRRQQLLDPAKEAEWREKRAEARARRRPTAPGDPDEEGSDEEEPLGDEEDEAWDDAGLHLVAILDSLGLSTKCDGRT